MAAEKRTPQIIEIRPARNGRTASARMMRCGSDAAPTIGRRRESTDGMLKVPFQTGSCSPSAARCLAITASTAGSPSMTKAAVIRQAKAITKYWTACVHVSERMPPGNDASAISAAAP
jgi:hypothetical protein